MIMPTLEDLKGYVERATGLQRPGKRKAMEFAERESLIRFALRTTVSSQITRDGRSYFIETRSPSMRAWTLRP
jgi:hypothetical protein